VACGQGTECTTPSCDVCTSCAPGFYKPNSSSEACRACPVNTFQEHAGSHTCVACPVRSGTVGLTGRTSRGYCQCDVQYYAATSDNSSTACELCPSGAVCEDSARTCALRSEALLCPGSLTPIIGEWSRNITTGRFTLLSCPANYTRMGEHDLVSRCAPNASKSCPSLDRGQCQCPSAGLVASCAKGLNFSNHYLLFYYCKVHCV